MRSKSILLTTCLLCGLAATAAGQDDPQPPVPPPATPVFDPVKVMVERLDLEKYKATIKGLTAFGDRRQGTERNRKAVDWIEAQLKSYGCTNTERITYTYPSPEASDPASAGRGRGAGQRAGGGGGRGANPPAPGPRRGGPGGGTQFGTRARTGVYNPDAAGAAPRSAPARAQCGADDARRAAGSLLHEDRRHEARRDVHRRRPHGRPRLGRGGQRRRIGHGARDGDRAHLQRAGRRDRAIDPLRPLEQRGERPQRRMRVRRPAEGSCRARKIRRARAGIPSRSGWA